MFSEIRNKMPLIVSFIAFSILLALLQNKLCDTQSFVDSSWSFDKEQYINHTHAFLKHDIQTRWHGRIHFYPNDQFSTKINVSTNNAVMDQHFEYNITVNGQWNIVDGVLNLSTQNITELKPVDEHNKEHFGLHIVKNMIRQQLNQNHTMHFYGEDTLVLNNITRALTQLNKI
ncbi:hypothetical protein FM037_09175 [Shewanella psychropiezotolerans]|uniref:Uncharacterized protein n=1 Tax=Shewanella psychropiezotolerans TaxID=2593655 RepID=A0ABX5WW96_9GAMM|nr:MULTISPECIES: regulatory protein ToxS [Shewanella]MPY25018.1 hypothetical protein [Shewanella sp. YLB-07]QDO83367.1 hypothetical protein FM037_09175 [Shewanella psychropiezotolerans]